jgi:transposase
MAAPAGRGSLLTLSAAVRILIWSEPVDMRKGIDGLSMLVLAAGEDMHAGHLFVFLDKRRHQLRVLTWPRGGFVLLTKRLDQGRFMPPVMEPGCSLLTRIGGPGEWRGHGVTDALLNAYGCAPQSSSFSSPESFFASSKQ